MGSGQAADGHQGVANLVGDACGELANGGQLFGLEQPVLVVLQPLIGELELCHAFAELVIQL